MVIQEKLYQVQIEEYHSHWGGKGFNGNVITLHVYDLVRCPLKRVYALRYPDIERSIQYQAHLILGKLLHLGLQRFLEIHGLDGYEVVGSEYDVRKRIRLQRNGVLVIVEIHGHVDILLKHRDTGELLPVEVKTSRGDHQLPLEHHVLQLLIYKNMLGASRGLLFYINPERIAEYIVEEQLDDGMLAKLVEEHLVARQRPRWPWECNYCPYNIMCPYKQLNNNRRR